MKRDTLNEQLYSIDTSFDEQMAKWMMSVSLRVHARVRERERAIRKSEGAERGGNV